MTLHPYINICCLVYQDNILIYRRTSHEHIIYVRQILSLVWQAGLQVQAQKYDAYKFTRKYLKMLVTQEGLKMDPGKVNAIEQWLGPQQLCNMWCLCLYWIQQPLSKVYWSFFLSRTLSDSLNEKGYPLCIVNCLLEILQEIEVVVTFSSNPLSLRPWKEDCDRGRGV
jgi:hypothetical protein